MSRENVKISKLLWPSERKYDFEGYCEVCCCDLLDKQYLYFEIEDTGNCSSGSVTVCLQCVTKALNN